MTSEIPAGFELIDIGGGFIGHNGPYYWRGSPDAEMDFGFWADSRHVNPNGVVHGGAIFAFLDTIAGHAIVTRVNRRCATIALDSRFMASTAHGTWISGRATIRKLTRSLAFVDTEALAGDDLLATASAVFRLFDSPHAT